MFDDDYDTVECNDAQDRVEGVLVVTTALHLALYLSLENVARVLLGQAGGLQRIASGSWFRNFPPLHIACKLRSTSMA